MRRGGAVAACAVILLTFAWIETRLADQPYDGPHEDNAAAFMGSARNHLRYGFARTLGHDLQEPNTGWYGDTSVEHRYLHHPPGLSLTLAGSIALFGDSRATGRLTAASFEALSLLAVMYGGYRFLGGWWTAALAGALFTLTPVGAFYGRSVSFQTFTLPFMLWSQILFLEYRDSRRAGLRTAAIVIAAAGALYDWDIHFWMAFAAAWELISPTHSSRWRAAMPWALASLTMSTLATLQIVLIAGTGNELFRVLLRWMGGGALSTPAIDAGGGEGWVSVVLRRDWWVNLGRLFSRDFTGPLSLAAAAFGVLAIARVKTRGPGLSAERLVAASAIPGLLYLFSIPAAMGHEYGLLPISAAMSWAAAAAIAAAPRAWRVPLAAVTLFCVIWAAGPWTEMWFGDCFAPYRIGGRCERPISFSGFGRITQRPALRPSAAPRSAT